jgi:outer membrane protein OmpA-like peptidoglycan-associated protein
MRIAALLASCLLAALISEAPDARAAGPASETVLYGAGTEPTEDELRTILFGSADGITIRHRGIVMKEKAPAPTPEVAEAAAAASPAPGPQAPRSVAFNIRFAFDSAALPADAGPQLAALAAALKGEEAAGKTILIVGHTDMVGSAAYNEALSERRAAATRRALVEQFGVPTSRLVSVGRGKAEPLSGLPGDAAELRRVEFQPVR